MSKIYLMIGLWIGLGALTLLNTHCLLVNLSASMPRGVWWCEKGGGVGSSMVAITPPEEAVARGCARQGQLLLKHVWARPGEEVCIEGRALYKGGAPNRSISTSLLSSQGQLLRLGFQGCKVVKEGELFVLGQHPSSCDSRYFGPIKTDRIVGAITPLLIWDHVEEMP